MGHGNFTISSIGKSCLSLAALFCFAGCGASDGDGTDTVTEIAQPEMAQSLFDVNMYPLNKLVCDPFDPGSNPEETNKGLRTEIFYREASQPKWTSVNSYIEKGTKSSKTLFFSDLNVPTRLFSEGFPTESGGIVENDQGDPLFEYFALKTETSLKLGSDDEPGLYEFAVLSDDGFVWTYRDKDGVYKTLVDNDGNNPTRMGCGVATIEMTKETEIIMEMRYYQGPRYHIAHVPMWRKVEESSGRVGESECGKAGNSRYFDPNNNSKPTNVYKGLLQRGWKPLDSENYFLPAVALFNPCVTGVAPVISGMDVNESFEGVGVLVTWNTDIPATSQVRIVNVATGVEQLTTSDNFLRTSHQVLIENLEQGQQYLLQAVSVSDTFGKGISQPVTINY